MSERIQQSRPTQQQQQQRHRHRRIILRLYLFYLCTTTTWKSASGQAAVSSSPSPSPTPTVQQSNPTTVVPTVTATTGPTTAPTIGLPTNSPIPTEEPSKTPTLYPTKSVPPSGIPSIMPTNVPTKTVQPSLYPSQLPTQYPSYSKAPSISPSLSLVPTKNPSQPPTDIPSASPSKQPTEIPSSFPTNFPTGSTRPSFLPSISPTTTFEPSDQPSQVPTFSQQPSSSPSMAPTLSQEPSMQPSISAKPSLSLMPSFVPSQRPSTQPSESSSPSLAPSVSHAPSVSSQPSDLPSDMPSDTPSNVPSVSPYPSGTPSNTPSGIPSFVPSEAPSGIPSAAPTFQPTTEERLIGIVISGLDRTRAVERVKQDFEELINNHTQKFWGPDQSTNWATVVYNSTTQFQQTRRAPNPNWRTLQREFLNIDLPPTPAPTPTPTTPSPPGELRSAFATTTTTTRQSSIQIIGENTTGGDTPNATASPSAVNPNQTTITPTLAPTDVDFDLEENVTMDSGTVVNGTSGNVTGVPNPGNGTMNLTDTPTFSPTTSSPPTMVPSMSPSIPPTTTAAPSTMPTSTYAPSSAPSSLPGKSINQIWYTQRIVYGERFEPFNTTDGADNDPRTTSIENIFQLPFMLDQTAFTEALIKLINNQLPLVVEYVEVREIGSAAPSVYMSETPSQPPSEQPSFAPSPVPSPLPSEGIGTTAIIVAVTVPVVVVLLIAFAGIIYVTRVDHDELLRPADESSFGEDMPLPEPSALDAAVGQVPTTGTIGTVGTAATGATVATGPTEGVNFGTPAIEPLIEPSELLQVAPLRTQTSDIPSEDHPSIVTTRRPVSGSTLLSNVSGVSDMSATDDRARRPLGTPGFMSPTGTFTPSQVPLASAPPPTPGRSAFNRAATTGGISQPAGGTPERLSPFQAVRGGIPTIPTSQLGGSSEVSSVRSGGGVVGGTVAGAGANTVPGFVSEELSGPASGVDDSQIAVSESEESDSEDPYTMTAFNLQIRDIDDFQ